MSQNVKIDPYGFREYDARWLYEKDINSAGIENLGKGLGTQIKTHTKKEKVKVDWDIELEDVLELWDKQEGKCALTGLFMTYHKDGSGKKDLNASIDRINPDIEYLVTNIQLVCSRANTLKHNLREDELYWWAKNIVEFKEND